MQTLRRRKTHEDHAARGSRDRPVLLVTLDVPYADEAVAFAVDSAVENGQPLVLVNVAEVLPTAYSLLGYGYVERDDLQDALRKPVELARSLAVAVERLRVCSPHPVDALLEVVAEREPGLLVFGPDRGHLSGRRYRRAERAVRERAACLVWSP
ncbi:MAG TPA: universal stress protein [Gaiellaceae bacterium]|nr:universal stress protein [Gaiellaceae bacterium]